jgi:predicted PurR-regulated permease PerM
MDGGRSVAIWILATAAVLAAAYHASSAIAPLALALFVIALVWPLQSRLQARMPALLALAITLLITVAVGLAFASLVAWGFGRVARHLAADAGRYQALYGTLVAWLDGHGVSVAGLWAEHFNVAWLLRLVQQITGRINTALAFWVVALAYLLLGLLEVDAMRRKLQAWDTREAARVVLRGSAATAVKLRRYMLIRTQMSVLTGILVGAFAWAAGLPFATEWGVIAFALNYIPFIGPFVATLLPTLLAMTQFETWQAVVAVFACLNVIQFLVGSYVEPRVAGSVLSISPFLVLFSVFLWTFLWGLFGAFIGVPITIAILTFCAQHPSSRWLADLLGGPAPPVPEA